MNDRLRFDRPPNSWIEGLPLGNGRIGAMVMGYPAREQVCLNHEAIWRKITDRRQKSVSQYVPRIRQYLLNGDWQSAARMLIEKLQPSDRSTHTVMSTYQPACDLIFVAACPSPVEDYERILDLARGIATVKYRIGGTTYERVYFVSAVDNVFVMQVKAGRPNSISGTLWLEREPAPECKFVSRAKDGVLTVKAAIKQGASFEAKLRVTLKGGSLATSPDGRQLVVAEASEVVIRVAINTSSDSRRIRAKSNRAATGSGGALMRAHVKEHAAMYQRAVFALKSDPREPAPTTDRLVHNAFLGKPSNQLFELMFGLGRYLMMASSRPGTQAITLQGIWNHALYPPWQSDWHLDMNVQMNYWLAEVGNLSECALPLFDLATALIPDGEENAAKLWGCRGIVFPIACAGGGKVLPGPWVGWTGAAGWLAQHFWWHYEYTLDQKFLAQTAYPFMKKVAAFYEDFLVKDASGTYQVNPSMSPENVPAERGDWGPDKMLTVNATMDIAIIRELLANLLTAAVLLDRDVGKRGVWREMLDHLPAWPVDAHGMLKEWANTVNQDNQAHRHFSHLYPLFPGSQFTEETPDLVAAAAKAFRARQACGYASNSGWSYPYMALLHARLGEGDEALQCLAYLAKCAMMDNLLTIHNDWRFQGLTLYWALGDRAFMIDAILGAAAAIAEMLLQSHNGLLRILPALPRTWPEGSVQGLRARGGFEVAVRWKAGVADEIRIRSLRGTPCNMKNPWTNAKMQVVCNGKPIPTEVGDHGSFRFKTKAGSQYRICRKRLTELC